MLQILGTYFYHLDRKKDWWKLKRCIVIIIVILSLFGVVIAESNTFQLFYTEMDWFSKQSAQDAIIPEGLTEHETEIYRAAYANGFYDALHPAYIEGTYMLNTKTKKFHLTNCPTTLLIESNNREYSTLTPEELMAKKYKPCGQCHPETGSTK